MIKILVCDDERDIVSALRIFLTGQGYEVIEAYNGEEAIRAVRHGGISLCLLDVMMPVTDGLTALRIIREESNVPVILLTAKSEDGDKIMGLDMGADDYVTKPFNPAEVIARVRSQLRRYMQLGGGSVTPGVLKAGGIVLDTERREVTLDGDPVTLTPTEFEILKLLLESPGRVFAPRDIYRRVWGGDAMGDERTIAVHIRHLREKLEIDPSAPRYITVVWGQGYKVEEGK
ncbi:MAG: response regulator transcription factor [Eubacteriales bacterium]